MSELILREQDLISSNHWPVTTIFGFYEGEGSQIMDFISIVESLGKGVGLGYNDAGCTFWDELDDYDKAQEECPFEVYCYVVNEGCTLSYAELFHYMEIASHHYMQRFPNSSARIQAALDSYTNRFLSKA